MTWVNQLRSPGVTIHFNPWSGCTKVSEGCKFCYAERDSHRNPAVNGVWGPNGNRVARVESYWKKAHEWNANWANKDRKGRVFCASLADVFEQWDGPIVDNKGYRGWVSIQDGTTLFSPLPDVAFVPSPIWRPLIMDDLRLRLFQTIMDTPNLNWQLLTKRIDQVMPTLRRCADLCEGQPASKVWGVLKWITNWLNGNPPENVWPGTSVEDQETANVRIPHLLAIPAKVRWVSGEPLLGPVDFRIPWNGWYWNTLSGEALYCGVSNGNENLANHIDWVIVGGESGSIESVRPFDVRWARQIRDQCKKTGCAFFCKQLGRDVIDTGGGDGTFSDLWPSGTSNTFFPGDDSFKVYLKDRSGSDISEWAEDIRIQEFPR